MTSSVPLVDPKIVSEVFEQQQQVRAYYSVSDVLDVDRYEIDGVDRAVVLGVRELDQSGIAEGDRNWTNLHTVYTHGDGVIAAYANQRPEDDSSQSLNIQWAEGQEANEDALTSLSPDGVESRVYFGETSPDYSVVGKGDTGTDRELVLPAGEGEETAETTYDGDGGVPVGGLFRKLLYAVKFSEPNFLLSGRVNENSKVLYDRNPRSMVEKVAPWLTVDSDPYPVVVDGRITVGARRLHRHRQVPAVAAGVARDDDRRLAPGGQRLPDAAHRRDQLPAQLGQGDRRRLRRHRHALRLGRADDPILKVWDEVFPGLIKSRDDIPEALMLAPALPRGPLQDPALPVPALPRDGRQGLVRGLDPVGAAQGPAGLHAACSRPTASSPTPTARASRRGPSPRSTSRASARPWSPS